MLVQAVKNINMSEIQEKKLTVAFSIKWRGAKLFLDSEPEEKAAPPLVACH